MSVKSRKPSVHAGWRGFAGPTTYSLLETERLISVGEAATGKDALEAQMILNHKEAIEFLIASADEIGFNRYTVLNLHALLSDNLLEDPTASGHPRPV